MQNRLAVDVDQHLIIIRDQGRRGTLHDACDLDILADKSQHRPRLNASSLFRHQDIARDRFQLKLRQTDAPRAKLAVDNHIINTLQRDLPDTQRARQTGSVGDDAGRTWADDRTGLQDDISLGL